ncbi:Twin-arginine translocation protein TatA [hydrothermal vent metagenome]|uniref:Twin-arginine translocation protein TatA n=1 Tax=hydrothermal vent metagenome TaxID=652676 RepID=A0A3B1CVX4_9ZZZZ
MLANFGAPEIVLIFATLLILFGAKKLPEIARNFGKGIKGFKSEMNTIRETVKRNNRELK